MALYLREDFQQAWAGKDAFAEAAALTGETFRHKEGRRTLRFALGGRSYFLKYHAGIGWGEVIKNLLQGRAPVLGARNEYEASLRLAALGLDTLTPAAFGERGINPARIESFLITDDLADSISLEDYCRDWPTRPPALHERRRLMRVVTGIVRTMHQAGINHRDCYLCHFLLYPETLAQAVTDRDVRCHLIDLHRAQIRDSVPQRWQVKDVAGLAYSAMDLGLSRRDWLRCLRSSAGVPLKTALGRDGAFWLAVKRRAETLYRKDMKREPPPWL